MEITLILGNGFDLNLGMKTGYRDFYEDYIKIESNNKPIIKMKDSIGKFVDKNEGNNILNWGDAEIAFGKFSRDCTNEEEYRQCYNDLEDHLADYIAKQNNIIKNFQVDDSKVLASIFNLLNILNRNDKEEVKINIVTLNYTDITFNIFFKVANGTEIKEENIRFSNHLYLHGKIGDEITFGVGNVTQIINQNLVANLPIGFVDQIIKDRHDSLTQRHHYQTLRKILDRSNNVYIYGWSFGDSDIKLIGEIFNYIRKDRKVVFYNYGFKINSPIRKSSEEKMYNDSRKASILNKMYQFTADKDLRERLNRNIIMNCNNVFEPLKGIVL